MAYHFLFGAVVGAASVLVLSNQRTRDLLAKGQHAVKDNLDDGVKAIKATGDCIRDKMQSGEEPPATPEKPAPAKRPQRPRKSSSKKAPADE